MKMKSGKKKETLEEFLSRVEELNTAIANITENTDKLKTVQKKILCEPSQQERQKLMSTQNDLIHDNKIVGRKIQKQIKEEQQKLSKLAKDESALNDINIRNTQIQSLGKMFLDIWTQYNNSQIEFREKNKKALLKNIKITDPNSNISVEEIEEKLDAGDVTVLSSIIKESAQAKEDVKMLENRHAEMMKLEKGITEIHEMFLDLSNMVNMQGEAVDRIEVRVGDAQMHVEEGREQLKQAKKKQKAARRKKFILAGIIAGVSLIVLLILIFTFL
jgi:syntaxin 1B/2/3